MESVSIAHRALVLRRGLSDRAPSVRNASVEMLKRWLEAFDGDVVKLLVGSTSRQTKRKPSSRQGTHRHRSRQTHGDVQERGGGGEGIEARFQRRRVVDVRGGAVLADDFTTSRRRVRRQGSDSAHAVGQAREIAVAEVGEMIEAMESAFPSTATDLLRIVNAHAAEADFKFAARQLFAAQVVDLNDGSIRRGAITLVAEQLRFEPTINAHGSSYACGGDGKWESALVDIARVVANDSTEFAGLVLDAADSLRMSGTPECLTQALYIAGSLLERTTKRLPSVAADAVMDLLIKPAVTHASTAVRRESMRVLGLLVTSQGVVSADAVVILRTALSADVAPVRCMAARALGDAALLHGLAALDAHRVLVDPEDDDVPPRRSTPVFPWNKPS